MEGEEEEEEGVEEEEEEDKKTSLLPVVAGSRLARAGVSRSRFGTASSESCCCRRASTSSGGCSAELSLSWSWSRGIERSV